MNTILYYGNGATKVVHRIIPSEFLYSVAHDYRTATAPIVAEAVIQPKPEDRAKERMKLLTAQADHHQHRGSKAHNEQRIEFISVLSKSRVPNWGDVHFSEL